MIFLLSVPENNQVALIVASNETTPERCRSKPAEYEDYALKLYKQPSEGNTKFDLAMKSLLLPSAKKIDLAKLVTVNRIRKFTAASHILKTSLNVNKTNKNSLPNFESNKPIIPTMNYDVLQKLMLRYYMEQYKTLLPTQAITYDARSLFNIPNTKRREYNFKRLIKNLSKKGYVIERFAYNCRNFISEVPVNVKNRIFYFENIIKYRKSGRTIVHIVVIENLLTTIPQLDESKQCLPNINNTVDALRTIQKSLVDCLPTNSVVILDYSLRKYKKPSPLTSKAKMQKWLRKNKIAFDSDAHKAELYTLVKKSVLKNNNVYYLEKSMKKRGHTILWKPTVSNISSMHGILTLLREKLKQNGCDALTLQDQLTELIKNTPLETWKEYDEFVARQEERCYSEDLMVTEIVDNIKTAARNLRRIMKKLEITISINSIRKVLQKPKNDKVIVK